MFQVQISFLLLLHIILSLIKFVSAQSSTASLVVLTADSGSSSVSHHILQTHASCRTRYTIKPSQGTNVSPAALQRRRKGLRRCTCRQVDDEFHWCFHRPALSFICLFFHFLTEIAAHLSVNESCLEVSGRLSAPLTSSPPRTCGPSCTTTSAFCHMASNKDLHLKMRVLK